MELVIYDTTKTPVTKMNIDTKINGVEFEGIFLPKKIDAQKYFIKHIEPKEKNEEAKKIFKIFYSGKEVDVKFKAQNLTELFTAISSTKQGAYAFEYIIKSENIEDDIFDKLKNILSFMENYRTEKVAIYLTIFNGCLPQKVGYKIREFLPFEKKNSPITFSYSDKKKRIDEVVLFVMVLDAGF